MSRKNRLYLLLYKKKKKSVSFQAKTKIAEKLASAMVSCGSSPYLAFPDDSGIVVPLTKVLFSKWLTCFVSRWKSFPKCKVDQQILME